jgi:glycosyltransferase involved in cell wall biosynthesis
MKISVVIPTWRRPVPLRRCLGALSKQTRLPDEVLLVVRADDDETRAVVDEVELALPIEVVTPPADGVVSALNAGFDAATGDLIVITDDDTEPRPDWLARIEPHFLADARLGGLGGRDQIVGSTERVATPEELAVGRVHWFGRVVGNHHLAAGGARDVDILKGVNMSLRREALGARRLTSALRGHPVQHNWEIELCLALRSEGWLLRYDPAVEVLHHEAQRPAGERERAMSDQERFDAVYNQTLAVVTYLRGPRRFIATAYAFLFGTRQNPGPVLALETTLRGVPPRKALAMMRVATAARRSAVRHWRR